jgi:uncharacterized protein
VIFAGIITTSIIRDIFMNRYKITTDLFVLPYKRPGCLVIYAPCLGIVLQANKLTLKLISNIENLNFELLTNAERETLDYFIQKGIINGIDTFSIKKESKTTEKLTLFPTNKCNLHCIYCYAGKFQTTSQTMDIKTAANAIHAHGKVLRENNMNKFILELHGGGEPFCEFNLLKTIVDYLENYCENQNFRLEIVASSNGVLTEEKRDWVRKHITSLLISFEGLPEIQNIHRPFPDNSPTFSIVDETLRYFDRNNCCYAIRTTVSNKNVRLLKETIDYISKNYSTELVFLEPVNDCGSGMMNHNLNCDMIEFGKNYLEAEGYARSKNIRTVYSGANIDRLSSYFCYVGTNQFAVTPDGFLTNCWEVTSNDHPQAETFIVGKIEENGEFKIYEEKIEYLKTFSVNQLAYCKDCFAKWHCSGDCVLRSGHHSHNTSGGSRCETTRNLMAHKLISNLENEKSII